MIAPKTEGTRPRCTLGVFCRSRLGFLSALLTSVVSCQSPPSNGETPSAAYLPAWVRWVTNAIRSMCLAPDAHLHLKRETS